jgi:hypothetical protein
MKTPLQQNILAMIVFVVIMFTSIFLTEKFNYLYIFGYIFKISLVFLLIASLLISRNAFQQVENLFLRYILIAILGIGVTLITGFAGLVFAVNFLLAIGGKL